MENRADLIRLLDAQRQALDGVEELTNRMLFSPVGELMELIQARGGLLHRAADIKEQIRAAACGDERLLEAVRCSCDVTRLDGESAKLFEAALRVRAAVNRICRLEADVLDRVRGERGAARESLEALNNSGSYIAADYKRAVQTGFPQGSYQERARTV